MRAMYDWFSGFSGGTVVRNSAATSGDTGLIPRLGRSPGRGSGNPLPRTEEPGRLQSMGSQESET